MPPAWQKALGALGLGYAGWKIVDGKYNLSADFALLPKVSVLSATTKFLKEPGAGMPKQWYATLRKAGQAEKVMFISADDGRHVTFGEVEELSNRVAQWALAQGLKPGDSVALMMDNRPEYMPVWLGLAKVRVIASLINTNTKGKPLIHAITIASCKYAIFGTEHAAVGSEVAGDLRNSGVASIWSFGLGSPAGIAKPDFCDASLDEALPQLPATPVDEQLWMSVNAADPCYYIYTSGTTGLPKACKVSHARLLTSTSLLQICEVTEKDVIYGSGMPLYHSAANLGVLAVVKMGGTYIIRSKFSASNHWKDCAQYNATVMQYIGELCRYLLATPAGPDDSKHKVRIAVGNGLRPEIWNEFQQRFTISEIGEFYGATEGNAACLNHCKNFQGQGAMGRAGGLTQLARPMYIVKFDVENELPIRDANGFCITCKANEPGELVAPIRKIQTATGEMDDFEGYTSKEASEKKILRDVFKKGDSFFRTGDLVRKDAKGYYYFVDRIGDTFRWKGENVSTMEVSEVVSSFPGVIDANVYGAAVQGKDGRACMVAMTLEPGASLDPVSFATHCRANLPPYAMPLFIRFLPNDINLTGTFKHQKTEYRNEGCDPAKVTDRMWWYDIAKSSYEPFGPDQYAEITAGRSKL
mmetsp:Transcript_74992/g.160592  ORF Transcript_74992/g.160592 Transcript_74992/m.160592 type:complete len:641 (-) Transcript_74992:41-1963(-)